MGFNGAFLTRTYENVCKSGRVLFTHKKRYYSYMEIKSNL